MSTSTNTPTDPKLTNKTLADKTVVITGATDGIGKETALELARLGATLIVVGRNPDKGKHVQVELQQYGQHQRVQFISADLSTRAGVNHLVDSLHNQTDHIDVLINNAGGLYGERWITSDDIEATYAMNHLNPLLLTWQLGPLLKQAEGARVINLTSSGHRFARVNMDNLQGEKHYIALGNYGAAKLVNLMTMYHWGDALAAEGIAFFAADPGGASTDMTAQMQAKFVPWFMRPLWPLMKLSFGRADPIASRQKAARSSIYAASSTDLNGQTGLYIASNGKVVKSSKLSYNTRLQKQLWELSMKQLELSPDDKQGSSVPNVFAA
ncbi:MAG: SDR family NAD(P)-dependent oxidoreductase, partial [Deinococcota bacterium]